MSLYVIEVYAYAHTETRDNSTAKILGRSTFALYNWFLPSLPMCPV